MKHKPVQPCRPPGVDTRELDQRMLLEARLAGVDTQVRQFARIRDRLAAQGADPLVQYRQLQARRDEVLQALKKLPGRDPLPKPGGPPGLATPGATFCARADISLLELKLVPAIFDRVTGIFGFGSSGYVQLGAAAEGVNDVIHGPHPSSGTIDTVPGAFPGTVTYTGDLNVGPDSIPQNQFNTDIDYFWVHNWKYLVPFPPPTTESRLTYRFDVGSRASVFFEGGEGTLMNFVSVGETNNLTTGNDVVVDTDAGWPLNVDLTQPGPTYNGHYGLIDGSVSVQRSFMVGGGHVPAVAIVVGVIASLSMMTRLRLTFSEYSSIGVGSGGMTRISYSYEPQLVATQG